MQRLLFFDDFIFFIALYCSPKAKEMDKEKWHMKTFRVIDCYAGKCGVASFARRREYGAIQKISTSNPRQVVASAMAVRDGRVE